MIQFSVHTPCKCSCKCDNSVSGWGVCSFCRQGFHNDSRIPNNPPSGAQMYAPKEQKQ
jgi:hypothetical protein